jgi:hypothetical protein
MDDDQARKDSLIDTTDCLEAVGVLRGWKNFSFIIIAGCLLVLQILFWVVNFQLVAVGDKTAAGDEPPLVADANVTAGPNNPAPGEMGPYGAPLLGGAETDEIREAAEEITADPNAVVEKQRHRVRLLSIVKFRHVAWLIRLLNFVLVLAAVLYCLTMLFGLKVSLLGRLGGINHICRAFFLSLAFLVLLLPWQVLFGPVVKGVIYTPDNLLEWVSWRTAETSGAFVAVLHYVRFTGYWLLVVLLLVFSLLRSGRWTKATLRRLEVI